MTTQQQFDRAMDAVCAYSDDEGFSRGDLLVAICIALGVEIPDGVERKSAESFLLYNEGDWPLALNSQ